MCVRVPGGEVWSSAAMGVSHEKGGGGCYEVILEPFLTRPLLQPSLITPLLFIPGKAIGFVFVLNNNVD